MAAVHKQRSVQLGHVWQDVSVRIHKQLSVLPSSLPTTCPPPQLSLCPSFYNWGAPFWPAMAPENRVSIQYKTISLEVLELYGMGTKWCLEQRVYCQLWLVRNTSTTSLTLCCSLIMCGVVCDGLNLRSNKKLPTLIIM